MKLEDLNLTIHNAKAKPMKVKFCRIVEQIDVNTVHSVIRAYPGDVVISRKGGLGVLSNEEFTKNYEVD